MVADQDLHGIKKFNELQLMKHCILYMLMCPAHPISNENLVNPISLENDNVANRVLATCRKTLHRYSTIDTVPFSGYWAT
jgi:hypothetical protein